MKKHCVVAYIRLSKSSNAEETVNKEPCLTPEQAEICERILNDIKNEKRYVL